MEFDWIIVGAGSAGSVLANRLTADGRTTVAVIEAGKPDNSVLIKMPMGLMWLMGGKRWNYGFRSSPQEHLDKREVPVPRGKALGGSSSINGMIYIRGHRTDFDAWATMGCPGWSYDDVLPYFRKSEVNGRLGGDGYHGDDGELHVSDNRDPHRLNERFFGAGDMLQIPRNPDFNGAHQEGLGMYQTTTHEGKRWSTADAFLRPAMNRPNLTVLTGRQVRRVIVEDKRAKGVETDQGKLTARAGVILAAGAIASPQLLQLSGIGDPARLSQLGIDLVYGNPAVGDNLHDHPNVMLMRKIKSSESYGLSLVGIPRAALAAFNYFYRNRGMFASNVVEAGGFARTIPGIPAPDVQFHFVPFHRSTVPGRIYAWGHGYALHVCVLRPTSRGRVDAVSRDPAVAPRIDPNMMATEYDRETLLRGTRLARRIMESPTFAEVNGEELLPGEQAQSDEDLMAFIRERCGTVYHPVGTCRMGSDAEAVVEPHRLTVNGLNGLHVVDASVMPQIVSGNTNAATIMIAEKVAEAIMAEARMSRAA
ncbi:GMC family oxidoreductase [Pseudoruegeria sp. HB172150]|uniref:GMC family oxidoreductase n=1 Tax=Pseudoruegeria sp. HB172150 TaxID=2721164 RepID=UPI0015533F32|nr:GMC family oxidoreductase N-terminal domain-containing protein [Pseudoruegeria sp. HB172150]